MKKILLLCTLVMLQMVSAQTSWAAPDNLVKRLAADTKVSEGDAGKQIDAVTEAIKAELQAGNEVTIRNFGRFYVQSRNAREGRNPKTGEKLQIPAKKYPKFASADGFKKAMN